MFTEGVTAKFPLLQEFMDLKTIDIPVIKNVYYVKRSSRFPVNSHIVNEISVSLNYIH